MENLIDDITKDVGLNFKEYGISRDHKFMFVSVLVNMIFLILSRSIGDREREYSVKQGKETFVQKYLADPVKQAFGHTNF